MKRRSTAGFSALELAMVMFLVTLATAAVIMWGQPANERARQTSCISNVKQISLSLSMYAADHDGWYPPHDGWAARIMHYAKNEQIFRCPSATQEEPDAPACQLSSEPDDALHVDYFYRAGLNSDDLPQTLLLWDNEPDRHNSRTSNAVRLDGSTIRLSEDQWPGIPAPPVTPEAQTGGQSQ